MLAWTIGEYLSYPGLAPRVFRADVAPAPDVEERRIRFGPDSHQYALTFNPSAGRLHRKHNVLFLHGGGWRRGNPRIFRFAGLFFARLGYPTVVAGYRLAPRHTFPAQLEDAYAALRAAESSAAFGSRRGRKWIAAGQSAGAQLAALLALDAAQQSRHGLAENSFAALLAMMGPLDFSRCRNATIRGMIRDLMGGPDGWEAADPVRRIRGGSPIPVLCIHGECDPLVEKENSASFCEAAGRKARLVLEPGYFHSNLAFDIFHRDLGCRRALREWLDGLEREAS